MVVAVVGVVLVVVVAVVVIAVRIQVVEGIAIVEGGDKIVVEIVIALRLTTLTFVFIHLCFHSIQMHVRPFCSVHL